MTGYNEAFIVNGEKKQEILNNCTTDEEREKTDQLIRPILRGRDIKRYGYDFADLWLINTHNGNKEKGISRINIEDYPAVKKHLNQYYPQLEKRADKGDTPYNLRNCAYTEDFFRPKILYPNMTKYMPFLFDENGFIANQKCFIITGENLAYLTAFFNSNVFKICFRDCFPELQGGTRELSKVFFEQIKIPLLENLIFDDFEIMINDVQNFRDFADLRLERALLLSLGLQEYEEYILNYKI